MSISYGNGPVSADAGDSRHLRANLRKHRRHLASITDGRVTRATLAKAIGVNETTYRRWERKGEVPAWAAVRLYGIKMLEELAEG